MELNNQRLNAQLNINLTSIEKENYKTLADKLGLTLNSLIRGLLLGYYDLINSKGLENIKYTLKRIKIEEEN